MLNIVYKKDNDCYYKINFENKSITKIQNNEVTYLDFELNKDTILKFKNIALNTWKNKENSFFISRHFQWEYNGEKFTTTDKPIEWEDKIFDHEALVFHNGQIWNAYRHYSPRLQLSMVQSDLVSVKRLIYGDNTISKWTDVKYCRHFEKIK